MSGATRDRRRAVVRGVAAALLALAAGVALARSAASGEAPGGGSVANPVLPGDTLAAAGPVASVPAHDDAPAALSGDTTSAYRLAGFADSAVFVRIVEGRRVGTIASTWGPDGAIESRLHLDSDPPERGSVARIACDGQGLWSAITIDSPEEHSTLQRESDRVVLRSGTRTDTLTLESGAVLYGPPVLLSLPVRRYDRSRGGEQRFPIFQLPGASGHASLTFRDRVTRQVGGLPLELSRFVLRLPNRDVALWTDAEGRIYLAVNEATRSGFARAGCESLFTALAAEAERPLAGRTVKGDWEGELQTPGPRLRLVLHVREEADTLAATLDSPDQLAFGLVVDRIAQSGDSLKLHMTRLGAGFAGVFDSSGAEVRGEWRQGPAALPLTLKRQSVTRVERRPQDPVPPYPYDTLEVAFENPRGPAHLAGTLTLPRGRGPFPAVLLITGSGQQDRNESIAGHRPFLVLADALTRRGIAVLRVDDRGTGGSTGEVEAATSEDFAGDVLAGVAFLKGHAGIDPALIGLIGHSEGGLIAPLAATRSRDVAFIVLMAGPGLAGHRLIPLQGERVARSMGVDEASIRFGRSINERMVALAMEPADSATIVARMHALSDSIKSVLPEAQKKALGNAPFLKDSQIRTFLTPWFQFFLRYDPAEALRHVTCPVLAINGSLDTQVPAAENLAVIQRELRAARNTDFKVVELPGLNHLFQTCKTGSVAEYHSIEETIAPVALATIGDWVVRHTARGPVRPAPPRRAPRR